MNSLMGGTACQIASLSSPSTLTAVASGIGVAVTRAVEAGGAASTTVVAIATARNRTAKRVYLSGSAAAWRRSSGLTQNAGLDEIQHVKVGNSLNKTMVESSS